jgi:hypothetical protein
VVFSITVRGASVMIFAIIKKNIGEIGEPCGRPDEKDWWLDLSIEGEGECSIG